MPKPETIFTVHLHLILIDRIQNIILNVCLLKTKQKKKYNKNVLSFELSTVSLLLAIFSKRRHCCWFYHNCLCILFLFMSFVWIGACSWSNSTIQFCFSILANFSVSVCVFFLIVYKWCFPFSIPIAILRFCLCKQTIVCLISFKWQNTTEDRYTYIYICILHQIFLISYQYEFHYSYTFALVLFTCCYCCCLVYLFAALLRTSPNLLTKMCVIMYNTYWIILSIRS